MALKADDECLYCGEQDSIDHTFTNCQFVKTFVNNVIDWFNATKKSKFIPKIEEKLFGIISGPYEKEILKKFDYTILSIYTSRMHNQAIHLSVFVDKVLFKYFPTMSHVGTLQQELSPIKNLVAKYSSTSTNNFPLIKQRRRQLFFRLCLFVF